MMRMPNHAGAKLIGDAFVGRPLPRRQQRDCENRARP